MNIYIGRKLRMTFCHQGSIENDRGNGDSDVVCLQNKQVTKLFFPLFKLILQVLFVIVT